MARGIKVVHYIPGRLRLRVEAVRRAPQIGRRVEEEFGRIHGVRKVRTNASTGSVLLEYDHAVVSSPETLEGLRRAVGTVFGARELAELDGYLERLPPDWP